MLRHAGVFRDNEAITERVMDSNDLEKERGITILAKSLSMITPPAVTAQLVPLAIEKGIKNIWMQPGAEHPDAVALCREQGINIIADGSCLLVVLGYGDH